MLTINNTLDGYLKDVEILGNTIQSASNLADIRSVGDKVEGQELYEIPVLSRGKNLINPNNCQLNFFYNGDYTNGRDFICTEVKVKANITYILNDTDMYICLLDSNRKYIPNSFKTSNSGDYKLITSNSDGFLLMRTNTDLSSGSCQYTSLEHFISKIQLEEGTVATPYEPYQEDKLTILSPVQLEKVGDVRDRIIEKNGVLGVEKNVVTKRVDATKLYTYNGNTELNKIYGYDNFADDYARSTTQISNKFLYDQSIYANGNEGIFINNSGGIRFGILSSKEYGSTLDKCKKWVEDNDLFVNYVVTTPQFIPLPHDQQIKLRTFANKTNISFGCEIEGTIKAQVPKSLGATVNTHTEQINNLNKELDRVKKLEESTVSTVTTESDFTTVEATSNGYFEDVKLEGKTLVNLAPNVSIEAVGNGTTVSGKRVGLIRALENNSIYTIMFDVSTDSDCNDVIISFYSNVGQGAGAMYIGDVNTIKGTTYCAKIITKSTYNIEAIGVYAKATATSGTKCKISNIVILEGDHTQNPPSYFEGLKSVGEDTDEIVVSSVKGDGNLFDVDKVVSTYPSYFRCMEYIQYGNGSTPTYLMDSFEPNTQYSFRFKASSSTTIRVIFSCKYTDGTSDKWEMPVVGANVVSEGKFTSKLGKSIQSVGSFYSDGGLITLYIDGTCINKGDNSIPYVQHQSDKKRLLYYNEETQAWEKPILREWDSIEKHANGKYYYHQRSGEVVLNGSENWALNAGWSGEKMSTNSYYLTADGQKTAGLMVKSNGATNIISEVMPTVFINGASFDSDCVSGEKHSGAIYIRINKSKVLDGIKPYLQQNPMRVVYQLVEEKVYECTNIDLITYEGETNYIVECGAIVPRTTLKVHNNISNVVSLLQKKVSLLESNITKYMITQNRMQLASTYSADSVTFKVDYALCSEEVEYNEDLYNLILNNILVGKDNYDYDKMFTMILDYASWNQISWEQFDILVGLMDIQHNPPVEEIPTEDEVIEETPNEIM